MSEETDLGTTQVKGDDEKKYYWIEWKECEEECCVIVPRFKERLRRMKKKIFERMLESMEWWSSLRGEDRSVKNPPSIVICNFQLFVIAFLVLFSQWLTNGAKSRRSKRNQ